MVKTTFIARLADAMPLAASMDEEDVLLACPVALPGSCSAPEHPAIAQDFDLREYKEQAKKVCKQLSPQSDPRCTISSGPYLIQ